MKTIIGYTDSVNECDCCGKTELKGTFCIDLDGVELYYGSVCAFKTHGVSDEEKKSAINNFKKEQQLEVMLADSRGTDFDKRKIVDFVKKKGLDFVEFIKKHGETIEKINDFTIYKYGCDCFNIGN